MSRAPPKNRIIQWPIDDIHIGPRFLQIDDEAVTMLMESMGARGLIHPIVTRTVSTNVDGDVETGVTILVAGLKRLTAAKRLGWQLIECREMDGDEIDAGLMEIAENLHRADLTPLQRDQHIAEWARLMQARQERDGHKPAHSGQVSKAKGGRGKTAGVSQAARDLGLSRQKIERAEKIDSICQEAKDIAAKLFPESAIGNS
jgi:ParB-like chromosome segregation protein Spo0J